METIIDRELVEKITGITQQWTDADTQWNPANPDRTIRDGVSRWAIRAIRSGLERGAMVEIGKICPGRVVVALGFDEEEQDLEKIGVAAFQAYRQGAAAAALDLAR